MTAAGDVQVRPGSLVVGYLHPGEVSHSFAHSMRQHLMWDISHNRRIVGYIAEECGAGRITDGRNNVVRQFLALPAEWLLFVDADMGWDPDAPDRLIDAADPDERPVVGGLCFAQRKGPSTEAGARRLQSVPTLYRWIDQPNVAGVAPLQDIPADTVVEVDATGCAFLLIHRSVLERLGEVFPAPRVWFDDTIYKGLVFGEDVTFCRRVVEHGYPIHVHTGVKTSHFKHQYLDDGSWRPGHQSAYVVIPVKNRIDLTRRLVGQLREQGDHEAIFIFDNGSKQACRNELDAMAGKWPDVEVFDAAGQNIHEMWNRGLDEATRRSWPCNVAILNNDITIGPDFLAGLSRALRSDPLLAAVSPNYDGRPGGGVEYVTDICAGRYDGTGGLAGFAFLMRADGGYRFPEELHWWYGDNDMLASILAAGSKAGIALDVTCEHVDGGSQTADWADPGMQRLIAEDRAWFEAKWIGERVVWRGVVSTGVGGCAGVWEQHFARHGLVPGSLNLLPADGEKPKPDVTGNDAPSLPWMPVQRRAALIAGDERVPCLIGTADATEFVEVVCDRHLRTTLGLADGDEVTVELRA